jgi:hypothetical protein
MHPQHGWHTPSPRIPTISKPPPTLVDTRKDGRRVIYQIRDGHLVRLVRDGTNHADVVATGEYPHP